VLVLVLAGTGIRRPAAATPSPPTAAFHPVGPRRVLDTRRDSTTLAAATTRDMNMAGTGVPAAATAVVLEVTATGTTDAGFVTMYPAGSDRPTTSVLNRDGNGTTVQNLVTMALGDSAGVRIYSSARTDLVVDLFGYYQPTWTAAAGRYTSVPPMRLLDTRSSGSAVRPGQTVAVPRPTTVPADATAIVLTATVDRAVGPGYWTAWPAGAPRPDTSNVNVTWAGQTVANLVVVPMAPTGVDFFSQSGGDLVVDVVGYFTGPSAANVATGLFVAQLPARILDTRSTELNPLGQAAQPQRGWTVEIGAGAAYLAAVATVTVVHALAPGYVTAYAAGQPRATTSTLNADTDATVAQTTIIPVGERGIALYTYAGGDLLVDVTGWYVGTPAPSVVDPPLNPAPPAPDRVVIPSIGVDRHLGAGFDAATLAAGPAYWPEFGTLGQPGNIVIGGHRTIDSGPFRHIDSVPDGGDIYLFAGIDRHHYRVVDRFVVRYTDGWPVARQTDAHEVTLFACEPPGSEEWRYALRAVEVRD
jgi:LPXTG-site transpeptidase (sortase) family protein